MEDERRLARQRASERAARVRQAWGPKGSRTEPYVRDMAKGRVTLERVEVSQDGDLTTLDVWVGGETENGDPHFRVVNPPLLVEDPSGDVTINGRRFRRDPLAALAEAIGQNGGAQSGRGRRAR